MKYAHPSRFDRIHLRLANSGDFASLRNLRQQVFCDELGIQDTDYYDVISDWHSKNIAIMDGGDLVGAVRLAFLPEWQEFYVSYLCIKPSHRNISLLRLIFGSLILLMRKNNIASVRADSAENNIPMYLAMGCVPIGSAFHKTGFRCAWTPLRYTIGVNAKAEEMLAVRTRASFKNEQSDHLDWRFETTIYNCGSIDAFRIQFLHLLQQDLIPGHLPHLNEGCNSGLEVNPYLSFREIRCGDYSTIRDSSLNNITESLALSFREINSRVSRRHVVLSLSKSDAIDLIRLYCISSRKYLIELSHWNEISDSTLGTAISVVAIFGPDDAVPQPSELRHHVRCTFGLISSDTLSSLSRKLLNSYLSSVGPMTISMKVGPIIAGACGEHQEWHPFMPIGGHLSAETIGRNLIAIGRHHRVIVPANVSSAATRSLSDWLASGQTIGASVQRTSIDLALSDDDALLLYGDPCVGFQVYGDVSSVAATDLKNLCARL